MKLIYIDETKRQESEERVTSLIEAYEQSDLSNKMKKEFELYEVPIEDNDHHSSYGQPLFSQMKLLMHRGIVQQTFREPLKIRASLAQSIVLSLLVGLVYLQISDDQQSVQDRQGALFFVTVNQFLSAVVGQVNTFPSERVLFYREHANNMYSMPAFFFAKIFADLPFQLVYPTIFSIISYFMVGFQSDRFALFWFLVLLVANVGASMGLLVGIKAKDATTAISSVPLVVIPFMLFSGFLINVDSTPPYFIWIEYLSPIKYCFQGIAINEFTDLTFTCSSDQKVPILDSNGTIVDYECRVPDGESVIESLSFQDVEIYQDFVALIVLYLGYRILGFVALLRQVRSTKANA
jgi:ATP-binding cassette subfamily G (WHITE) protein 1/ATP-binding cassette subfamily G (WHITE) protein 2